MCGICGIIEVKGSGISLQKLQAMNDRVIHRGPDDAGFAVFTENGEFQISSNVESMKTGKRYRVGLGHRRLSIIDLSQRAHQPMFDEAGRYCIVYNGELYNYKELRDELKAQGVHFLSDSDTEVVLSAYIMWGKDCLTKFNGMWSFAIYDRKDKLLFCSRDNFGIKPFYYMYGTGYFIFASEIKQILAYYGDNTSINEKILAELLLWGYETHTEQTFFNNISVLPQSHYLMINLSDLKRGHIKPRKYWEFEREEALPVELAIQRFKELFFHAVNIRLRSDVPVGTTLSGGLDSSSIACVIAEINKGNSEKTVPTMFTSEYADPGMSEKKFADSVARKTGFNHCYIYTNSYSLKEDWNKFVWHMEEPFDSLSYYSNWKIYEQIKQKNTPVVLIGQGGDELLLGYERYRMAYFKILFKDRNIKKILSEFLETKQNANMTFSKLFLYQIYFTFPLIRIFRRLSLIKPYLKTDFYNSFSKNTLSVKDEMHNKDMADLQQKEFYKYQLQHLLRHEDRVSMAFSIESRLPFLDYRLFNLMLSVDDSLKLNSGWSKYILRQALDGVLPDSIKNRTDKMGYETPSKRLFFENKDFFLEILNRNINDEYINVPNTIKGIINNNIEDKILCRILTFLSWREMFSI